MKKIKPNSSKGPTANANLMLPSFPAETMHDSNGVKTTICRRRNTAKTAPSRKKNANRPQIPPSSLSISENIFDSSTGLKQHTDIPPGSQAQLKATPDIPDKLSDQILLDTVRDRVYQKLICDEIELDLADGFKAIEIKHKISEDSQNEKLLLEILNEIRADELRKGN